MYILIKDEARVKQNLIVWDFFFFVIENNFYLHV